MHGEGIMYISSAANVSTAVAIGIMIAMTTLMCMYLFEYRCIWVQQSEWRKSPSDSAAALYRSGASAADS